MTSNPPEWFQVAAPLLFSSALSIGVFWQPQWMHRLFGEMVRAVERLAMIRGK